MAYTPCHFKFGLSHLKIFKTRTLEEKMMTLAPWRFDYTLEDYSRYLRQHPQDPQAMGKALESCIMSDKAPGTS